MVGRWSDEPFCLHPFGLSGDRFSAGGNIWGATVSSSPVEPSGPPIIQQSQLFVTEPVFHLLTARFFRLDVVPHLGMGIEVACDKRAGACWDNFWTELDLVADCV